MIKKKKEIILFFFSLSLFISGYLEFCERERVFKLFLYLKIFVTPI